MKVAGDNINIWALQLEMQPVLLYAELIWTEVLAIPELTVTSGRSGIHSAGSLHYYGYAVDLRTWTVTGQQASQAVKETLAKKLREVLHRLSPYYDVIVHSTHIHVEWDAIRAGKIFTL